MTKRTVSVLTFSVLAAFSMVVSAEQAPVTVKLSQVTGNVMVNDGTRFVKASSGIQIKPGTKVIASKDSTLDLIYQNGCVKQVKANTMLTVGTQAECVAKISDERIYVAAVGNQNNLGQSRFLSNPLVIAGIVATAIAVPVALVNSNSSNNNDPVSP
jgi:hypothetical protein